jgi:hypothetical protein
MDAMEATERVAYDGKAIGALALAVAAIITWGIPVLSLALAVGAIVAALVSRQTLRREAALRGARLGLLAFIIGVVVAAPRLIAFAVQLLG